MYKNPSVADASVADDDIDPRHSPIRGLIQQLHLEKFRVKCEWDASEGKVLDRLLGANPSWTEAQLCAMARNRFDSEGVSPERPRKWLPNLGSYTAGPLDRYGKQKTAKADGQAHLLPPSEIARRQHAGEEWQQ
jgi:hypothetical protein